jgi:HAD superfamily hydrolase (TIGR01662 family)
MTKVLLFDLDGTLLPMDTERFVQVYLKALSEEISPYIDPEFFVKALWKGTRAMIENTDPSKTNEAVFKETFIALTKVNEEEFWPILNEFYEKTFPSLSHVCQSTPLAKQLVEEAIKQGYRVAVATNPVFPKLAIEHRITWAGVDHTLFDLITFYEDCNFTKPHPEYYEMICRRLGVSPKECMMIGNDMQEDISASRVGMKTFLVEGNTIDRGEPVYNPDARGTMEELYHQLKNKEGLFKEKIRA